MPRTQTVQRLSLVALVGAAFLPALLLACATGSASGTAATAPGARAGAQSTPPGATPPPGYGQMPPPAYPQQQPAPGYAQQPAPGAYSLPSAPAQPAPGYAAPAPQQPVPPGATAAASASAAPPGPLGSVLTTDPNQLAAIFSQAAAAGQALLQNPGQVPGDPVEIGLKAAALTHAKGEQLQGQIAKANLQEGGHNEFMVTMQPGTCYTIIGFSPMGQVKNVDLHLLAPPFYNVLAGQDTTDTNQAIIGSTPNPMCPFLPLPLQYKVDITARSGSGTVAVGVYTNPK